MNLLADENVHRLVVARLRAEGHDVLSMTELAPTVTDQEVLALAVEREALLLTHDLDFGELIFVGAARHVGVLLLRLGDMPVPAQVELVAHTLSRDGESLGGAFSVLTRARLRIRS